MKITKRKAKGVLADMIANMDEDSLAKTREKMMKEIKIEEDLCSFDVCQMLKEKGFQFLAMIGSMWIDSENKVSMRTDETIITWDNGFKVPVVSHALAMKWLREKGVYLNIRIALNRMEDDVINNIHWVVDILDFNSGEWKNNDIWTDTYEEAVEAALKYAIKNLNTKTRLLKDNGHTLLTVGR